MSAMIAKVAMIVVDYHPVIQASNSDVSGGDIEAFDDNAIYYGAIVYEYDYVLQSCASPKKK